MRWKKGIIATVLILLVATMATVLPTVTNSSEKELIGRTLNIALIKKELPDYAMLMKQKSIILSTENIDQKLIPKLPGVNLTVLSPHDIQKKADAEGDFLYLRFKEIKIGTLNSSVSLDNVWICSKDSNKAYQSGGGLTVWFYNILGKWFESPVRQSWIS